MVYAEPGESGELLLEELTKLDRKPMVRQILMD